MRNGNVSLQTILIRFLETIGVFDQRDPVAVLVEFHFVQKRTHDRDPAAVDAIEILLFRRIGQQRKIEPGAFVGDLKDGAIATELICDRDFPGTMLILI